MKNYTTSDLSLAAFLMMKGYKLVSAGNPGRRFEFIFEDKNSSAHSHALEYVNSEFCKFDNHLRSLRKILYKN
tara:strand:- start:11488 stop:11706 length:219 start_codon:yes stop_codon:yes gene_type:complete